MSSFMSQWVYTDVVKDHFMNPRNLWNEKEEFNPDGVGEVGSLACGDQMRVGIKVKNDKIMNPISSLDTYISPYFNILFT